MAFMVCELNGYIIGIGKNQAKTGGVSKSKYNQISELFKNKPIDTDEYRFMLRSDTLEWEQIPIEKETLSN